MSAKLQVRLLGGFYLTYEGKRVTAIEKSARLQALLAYLLLNAHHPQSRQQIAYTFWPDSTESQARTNLRKLLHRLQKALPDAGHYLKIEGHSLQWNVASPYQLDVDQLEDVLELVEQDPATDASEKVLRLYRGRLLPPADAGWLDRRRQSLQRRVIKALAVRADHHEGQGRFDKATAVLQQLLSLDPYEEAFYRRLMRVRARAGDRSGAVRAFQAAQAMLQGELGVPPSRATRLLYERIVAGEAFSGPGRTKSGEAEPPPFTGRHSAWESALELFASLQRGGSRCLWISGEAGIGKTRLAEELLAWAYLDGYLIARTRSYAAQGDLAYAPVAQLFRRSPLAPRLRELDEVWQSELSRIVPELLVDRPGLPRPGPLAQGTNRVRFYEALCEAILSHGQPAILLFDDLQWCDEETFAWLHFLLQREHDSRLLVVGAYRDDEIGAGHPLNTLGTSLYREGQLVDIRLLPLVEEDAAQLAEAVSEERLDAAARRALYGSTQGNPLFIVELMRARRNGGGDDEPGAGSGTGPGTMALPARVVSLIQHRLGRLSPASQAALDLAALIGRPFELPLLAAANHIDEEAAVDLLDELCARRVLSEQRAGVFDFTHDTLRDVVLMQIGATRKRLLSRHIAHAYEAVYAERLDAIVGELAVAHEDAGQYRAAVSYYQQMAEAEIARAAYKRARRILQKALALIDDVGEQADLEAEALALQLMLASVAEVIHYRSSNVRDAFARALQLGEALDNRPAQVRALFGLAHYYVNQADLAQARDFCRRCIAVAEAIDDRLSVVRAYLMFGFLSLILGEFVAAKESLERVRSDSNRALAQRLTSLQGADTGVMANIFLSLSLWFLGYPEQSDEAMAEARVLAAELGLPLDLAFAASYGTLFSLIKHDIPQVEQYADRLLKMAEQYEISFTLIFGRLGQAYVAASRRPGDPALIEAFIERLVIYQEQITGLSQPFFLSLKARLLLAAKRYREAEAALEEAVALMDASGDCYSAGEVYRLQAEVAALSGNGNPEEIYLQAIAVSEAQQAKMLQLRAAVGLCRLWQRQDRREEAHRLLASIYDWFSEGLATRELQEARALLNDLERSQ